MTPRPPSLIRLVAALLLSLASSSAVAQETARGSDDAELARQLANPVASLISVPLQNNWDFGYGEDDGWRYTGNVQPVIPFSIGKDWNLISRTILPIVYQDDVLPDSDQAGLGDTVQSLFLSPKEPWPFGIVQIGLLGRWWAETPRGGPDWGFRLPITFLFPR